uniref:CARD domain-containing protein n=1 Tax=Neogobius melanostomus TaxID=47308 RepID=A0A8C6TJR6_9GOBI
EKSELLLRSVRLDFIEKVSEPVLHQLLDRLQQEEVLNPEEAESVREKPRAEKARLVLDTVEKKSQRAASVLIRGICELDPSSELGYLSITN